MAVYSAEQIPPTLRLAFKQRRLIPFLGAGFSAPLQLPTWGELVGWMADKLGWERELFELHGTYPQLAEFFSLEPQAFDDLVHEMTRRFDAPEVDERRRSSPTHRALAAFPWKTIYTTNYDGHVEGAMKDAGRRVHVLASLSDFLQTSRAEEACEVVKFHGTLRLKETIVLSESHYFARMDLNAAVDQRLRAGEPDELVLDSPAVVAVAGSLSGHAPMHASKGRARVKRGAAILGRYPNFSRRRFCPRQRARPPAPLPSPFSPLSLSRTRVSTLLLPRPSPSAHVCANSGRRGVKMIVRPIQAH